MRVAVTTTSISSSSGAPSGSVSLASASADISPVSESVSLASASGDISAVVSAEAIFTPKPCSVATTSPLGAVDLPAIVTRMLVAFALVTVTVAISSVGLS